MNCGLYELLFLNIAVNNNMSILKWMTFVYFFFILNSVIKTQELGFIMKIKNVPSFY